MFSSKSKTWSVATVIMAVAVAIPYAAEAAPNQGVVEPDTIIESNVASDKEGRSLDEVRTECERARKQVTSHRFAFCQFLGKNWNKWHVRYVTDWYQQFVGFETDVLVWDNRVSAYVSSQRGVYDSCGYFIGYSTSTASAAASSSGTWVNQIPVYEWYSVTSPVYYKTQEKVWGYRLLAVGKIDASTPIVKLSDSLATANAMNAILKDLIPNYVLKTGKFASETEARDECQAQIIEGRRAIHANAAKWVDAWCELSQDPTTNEFSYEIKNHDPFGNLIIK